jgi:hypothetical protein
MPAVITRLVTLAYFVWIPALLAQSSAQVERGNRHIGFWMGLSPNSRVGEFAMPHRQLVLLGARAEWVIEALPSLTLAATSDIVPVAVITHTPTYTTRQVVFPGGGTTQLKEQTGNEPVYGAGGMPFGFKLLIGSSSNVRLFGATSVGGLWFTRDVPIPDGRRFNFSFEYGGGIEFGRRTQRTIILGYKFHHLSNANSAAVNPGLDSGVIYVGISRPR